MHGKVECWVARSLCTESVLLSLHAFSCRIESVTLQMQNRQTVQFCKATNHTFGVFADARSRKVLTLHPVKLAHTLDIE